MDRETKLVMSAMDVLVLVFFFCAFVSWWC